MKTTVVSQTSSYIAPVLPIILCAPKFLDGSMSLGEVMQAASAFTIVQGAFNWLVDNYPKMADWTASARRAASLMVALDALEEAEQGEGVGRITMNREGDGPALHLQDLSVRLNDGTAVVGDTDVAIEAGERVLIAGEFGVGQEHVGACHRRLVALGRRFDRGEERCKVVPAAAAPICADRHASPCRQLSGCCRKAATSRT